ncbi:hypothetical protein [Aeromonas caviae]|uniref:hypothetical protein n=1 Tax=Aeromonas caviae TaxID=648 RepID=UPI0029D7D15F|nr:hypothetical protein [Aeromonas caviae]MDX7784805.1 hypothetical protein [Aeromonas caviae]
MNIGMLFGMLIVGWALLAVLLVLIWVALRAWREEVQEDEAGLLDEPRLVSACRELSELAAKTKEASHG